MLRVTRPPTPGTAPLPPAGTEPGWLLITPQDPGQRLPGEEYTAPWGGYQFRLDHAGQARVPADCGIHLVPGFLILGGAPTELEVDPATAAPLLEAGPLRWYYNPAVAGERCTSPGPLVTDLQFDGAGWAAGPDNCGLEQVPGYDAGDYLSAEDTAEYQSRHAPAAVQSFRATGTPPPGSPRRPVADRTAPLKTATAGELLGRPTGPTPAPAVVPPAPAAPQPPAADTETAAELYARMRAQLGLPPKALDALDEDAFADPEDGSGAEFVEPEGTAAEDGDEDDGNGGENEGDDRGQELEAGQLEEPESDLTPELTPAERAANPATTDPQKPGKQRDYAAEKAARKARARQAAQATMGGG